MAHLDEIYRRLGILERWAGTLQDSQEADRKRLDEATRWIAAFNAGDQLAEESGTLSAMHTGRPIPDDERSPGCGSRCPVSIDGVGGYLCRGKDGHAGRHYAERRPFTNPTLVIEFTW